MLNEEERLESKDISFETYEEEFPNDPTTREII